MATRAPARLVATLVHALHGWRHVNWVFLRPPATALLLFASACFGDLVPGDSRYPNEDGGPGGSDDGGSPVGPDEPDLSPPEDDEPPRSVFERLVQPTLESLCGACHADESPANGPDFLGLAASYYDSLVVARTLAGAPMVADTAADSPLVAKGAHAGPALPTEASEGIDLWLESEKRARDQLPPESGPNEEPPLPTPANTAEALQWFASCMSRERWDQYDMGLLARTETDREPCYGCHAAGENGTYLSEDSIATLQAHRDPFGTNIRHLVTPLEEDDETFIELTPSVDYLYQGAQPTHPLYALSPERREALAGFVQSVLAASMNGPCP